MDPEAVRMCAADCSQLAQWSQLAGWDVEYVQVGRGELRSWLAVASCGQLRLTEEYCSHEMVINGAPGFEAVSIILPFAGGCSLDGTEVAPTDVIKMGGHRSGCFVTPRDFRACSATIPVDLLTAAVSASDPEAADGVGDAAVLRLPETDRGILWAIMTCVSTPRAVGLQAAELEDRLVSVVARGLLRSGPVDPVPSTRSDRLNYVERARRHINANLAEVLRVADIARAVGVSVRTLEYAFQDVLGMGPLAWVRIRRLNEVRRRLLMGATDEVRVTDVAFDHGLGHLSWFARDYKKLFAERPSETVARGMRLANATEPVVPQLRAVG